LRGASQHKLNPEVPSPRGEILLDGPTAYTTNNGTQTGEERRPKNSKVLFLGRKHVGNHAHGYRATGRRHTAHDPTTDDGLEVRGEGANQDRDVCEAKRRLHYGPAPELIRPRRPKLVPCRVGDQKCGQSQSRVLEIQ
jgi:hypothetical protein